MIEKAMPPDDKTPTVPVEAEAGRMPEPATEPEAPASGPPRPLAFRVEALLFASGQPLTPARLAAALGAEQAAVQAALEELALAWRAREGAIELVEIAGGWRLMTRPDFHGDVAALRKKTEVERLSPAALETLAVVAYRQPIGRADIEAVRGVACGPVLRLLLERDLIRITGRSPEPGHPLLYGTTKRFLDHFGLKSLKALPDVKDLLETS
jgi:segregation and condensation protein B